jgi:hypothetical protein
MADFRDDSPLFSLKGLLSDRSPQDEEGRKREARIALALRIERERLAREAEAKKQAAIAEAARLTELRRREEDARLEALARVTVERARVEAEALARLEMMEKQQAHERKLVEIQSALERQRARGVNVVGFALALVVVTSALSIYFFRLKPDAARLQVAYGELVRAERLRAEETKRLLERSESTKAVLSRELSAARARIRELERQSAAASK